MSYFSDVRDFHEKFGLKYDGPPRDIDTDLQVFRTTHMIEELCEYVGTSEVTAGTVQGILVGGIPRHGIAPPEKALDALVDLVYVALGTAYVQGFDFDEAWRRVHEANMKKVRAQADGADSKRGSGYDVVKPPGWQPASLKDLVTP